MIVGVDPNRAPLNKYASPHLKEIKLAELTESLQQRGVELLPYGPNSVRLSLRNLLVANGTIQRAQQELMSIIQELGGDAVTVEAADVEYLSGRDVFSHAIATGLEANLPVVSKLLTEIPISEGTANDDPFGDRPVVPIFDRLDQAAVAVVGDSAPDGIDFETLRHAAHNDLANNGLLETNTTAHDAYRNWLDNPPVHDPAQLPEEYRTEARPFVSPWDKDGEF